MSALSSTSESQPATQLTQRTTGDHSQPGPIVQDPDGIKWASLPDEIFRQFFIHSDLKSLLNTVQACKSFKNISSELLPRAFFKEILLPLVNKREIEQVKLGETLLWGPVSKHLRNILSAERRAAGSDDQADPQQQLPNRYPFARMDNKLDINAISVLNNTRTNPFEELNQLVIDLDKTSTLSDLDLDDLFGRIHPTSFCVKGNNAEQLERLMPYLQKHAPQMESLDVSYSCMTSSQFTSIVSAAPQMKNLFISGLDIACLPSIASHCPKLEMLIASALTNREQPSTIMTLSETCSFPSLEVLDFSDGATYGLLIQEDYNLIRDFILKCPNLEKLSIADALYMHEVLARVTDSLPSLNTLDITGETAGGIGTIEPFLEEAGNTNVEVLYTSAEVTDVDQAEQVFALCPSLKSLIIRERGHGEEEIFCYRFDKTGDQIIMSKDAFPNT